MPVGIVIRAEGFENAKQRFGNMRRDKLISGSKFFARKRIEESMDSFRAEVPVGDTQQLADSLELRVEDQADGVSGTIIAMAAHARWVSGGTGVFGPFKQPIIPVRAKVLVFRSRDGNLIRARSVKGQPANPFLKRGAAKLRQTLLSTLPTDARRAVRVIVAGGG